MATETEPRTLTARDRDTVQLKIPATYQYLRVIGSAIGGMLEYVEGIREREILTYNVELAVNEICANIVGHAYADQDDGHITVTLTLMTSPRALVIDLYDNGRSFDMTSIKPPDLDDPQIRGYGLFLARELTDELLYEPVPEGNHWRLTKNLA